VRACVLVRVCRGSSVYNGYACSYHELVPCVLVCVRGYICGWIWRLRAKIQDKGLFSSIGCHVCAVQDGWTALMFAVLKGHGECLSALVAAKADVNVQEEVVWLAACVYRLRVAVAPSRVLALAHAVGRVYS
jgi:hypothetical protein